MKLFRSMVALLAPALLAACAGDLTAPEAGRSAGPMASVWWVGGDGAGFVGKGDVQLVYGWNNKQLQENADLVTFRTASSEVAEVSWECTNENNQKVQERSRTTTSSTAGLLSSVARVKSQVTGFNLTGFNGGSSSISSADGPPLNSCPNSAGTWSLTLPAGDPVVVSSSTSLQVSTNGSTWHDVP